MKAWELLDIDEDVFERLNMETPAPFMEDFGHLAEKLDADIPTDDYAIRSIALSQAIRHHKAHGMAETAAVVGTAREFEAYLKGETNGQASN